MAVEPTRRGVLAGGAAAGALGALGCQEVERRPNILLILPDQLRASALGAFGETNIETPVLDRFLAEGTHFPLAFAADPVCAPARAALLTGRYPTAVGVARNGDRLAISLATLSSRLDDAGYATGYVGKWHLDSDEQPGFVPPERRHRFRWWSGYNAGQRYRTSVYFRDTPEPLRPVPANTFEPEYQTDHALEFIASQADRPWFLMLSYGIPHPPGVAPIQDWSIHIPQSYLDAVDPEAIHFPPNVPAWIQGPNVSAEGGNDPGARTYLQGYYASILALEDSIERLLEGLRERGQEDRTLVVLTSDHGDMGGAHGLYQKGEPYEEAIRVPLAFRWPGVIPAGVEHGFPVSHVDVAPTLLSIAAGNQLHTHGMNLATWLLEGYGPQRGAVQVQGRLDTDERWFAIRDGRYTYAELDDNRRPWLFDNRDDPWQLENQAGKPRYAEVERRLAQRLSASRLLTLF